jgi:GNAT superfamily N-acetyltransferase
MDITTVTEQDLDDLLPLMRAYCDFYEVAPTDEQLLTLSRALIADPDGAGFQLLAREGGEPLGFATTFWRWSTTDGGQIAYMNDLFVVPAARGKGIGRALIEECRRRAVAKGMLTLDWVTALDNHTAQRLYDTTGAKTERWLTYTMDLRAESSGAQERHQGCAGGQVRA